MIKKMALYIVVLNLLTFGMASNAFCWDFMGHYWLNKSVSDNEVFCSNSMGPDFFWITPSWVLWESEKVEGWALKLHSPNPIPITSEDKYTINDKRDDKEKKWNKYLKHITSDKENFAYIMKKCSSISTDENVWKGWGGHIAADWVAHDEAFLGLVKPIKKRFHGKAELDMGFYLYLTKGTIPFKITTDPWLIYKALVNKRMIELKRENDTKVIAAQKTIELIRDDAFNEVNNSYSVAEIKSRIGLNWRIGIILSKCYQDSCKGTSSDNKFIKQMEESPDGKVVLQNYTNAKASIKNWYENLENMKQGIPTTVKIEPLPLYKSGIKDEKIKRKIIIRF
ncbi:MAG: hypothetical protein V1749_09990 [Candidatus Desantisbacteria bacterium]